MPATITIVCPECDKRIKAPAAAEGKKIRCKACDAIFVAIVEADEVEELDEVEAVEEQDTPPRKKPAAKKAAPKAPPAKAKTKAPPPKAAAKKPAKPEEDEDNPYGLTYEDLSARCPECANLMESEDAKICLYCGFNVETRERARTRKVRDQTAVDYILWLLPGVACALAVIAMITWIIIHWGPLANWLGIDPDKESDRETWTYLAVALFTKIWTTIPLLYLIYLAGFFAIKRLAIDYKPPEIEEKITKKV
jgi:hypothetical protein